jgi:hypothetical protein
MTACSWKDLTGATDTVGFFVLSFLDALFPSPDYHV